MLAAMPNARASMRTDRVQSNAQSEQQGQQWSLGAVASPTTTLRGAAAPGGIGVVGRNVLQKDDLLSFTMTPPIRVYRVPQPLTVGADRNWDAPPTFMSESQTALMPLAAEIAVQGAYRSLQGPWLGQASLGYSFNAGQIAGRDEVRALFSLSRRF
jgi:hypothetical protein